MQSRIRNEVIMPQENSNNIENVPIVETGVPPKGKPDGVPPVATGEPPKGKPDNVPPVETPRRTVKPGRPFRVV